MPEIEKLAERELLVLEQRTERIRSRRLQDVRDLAADLMPFGFSRLFTLLL